MVSATRYAASPVGSSALMPALRIADSIGSTDTTGAPMRMPTTSAIVLLPAPGSPAVTISTVRRSEQFGGARDHGDDVVLHGEESVLRVAPDHIAVERRDPPLALGEHAEHRLMPRQQTDLTDQGARDHLAGFARPELGVRRDHAHRQI